VSYNEIMIYGYIYVITHIPSGRYYIGQRKNSNPEKDDYWGSGVAWKQIFNKHPKKEFEKQIIALAYSKKELDALEKEAIGELYQSDPLCKNLMAGGNTHMWSEESRRKLSKFRLSHPRQMSEEQRKRLSEANSGENNYFFGKHFTGKNNPFYGKHHSVKTRAILSKKNKGRKLSEETKRKMSLVGRGKPKSETMKKHLSEARKGRCWISEEGRRRIGEANRNRVIKEQTREKWTKQRTGRKWFNDGKRECFVFTCPDGFVSGRLKR